MKKDGVPVAEAKLVTRAVAASAHALDAARTSSSRSMKARASASSSCRPAADSPSDAILAGGPPDQIVMVERFIAGRELTCAVIGDFATDVIEIVPLKGLAFYDFEAEIRPRRL